MLCVPSIFFFKIFNRFLEEVLLFLGFFLNFQRYFITSIMFPLRGLMDGGWENRALEADLGVQVGSSGRLLNPRKTQTHKKHKKQKAKKISLYDTYKYTIYFVYVDSVFLSSTSSSSLVH